VDYGLLGILCITCFLGGLCILVFVSEQVKIRKQVLTEAIPAEPSQDDESEQDEGKGETELDG